MSAMVGQHKIGSFVGSVSLKSYYLASVRLFLLSLGACTVAPFHLQLSLTRALHMIDI